MTPSTRMHPAALACGLFAITAPALALGQRGDGQSKRRSAAEQGAPRGSPRRRRGSTPRPAR